MMKHAILIFLVFILAACQSVGTRTSPKMKQMQQAQRFLNRVLQAKDPSSDWMEHELSTTLDKEVISLVACTCRIWASRNTSKGAAEHEDYERLVDCFTTCLRVLKQKNAIPALSNIYYSVNISDGWLMYWYETLGEEWARKWGMAWKP